MRTVRRRDGRWFRYGSDMVQIYPKQTVRRRDGPAIRRAPTTCCARRSAVACGTGRGSGPIAPGGHIPKVPAGRRYGPKATPRNGLSAVGGKQYSNSLFRRRCEAGCDADAQCRERPRLSVPLRFRTRLATEHRTKAAPARPHRRSVQSDASSAVRSGAACSASRDWRKRIPTPIIGPTFGRRAVSDVPVRRSLPGSDGYAG